LKIRNVLAFGQSETYFDSIFERRNVMCKKLIFLTSLIVVLTCFSMANATFEIKVDITKGTTEYTYKGGDWLAWGAYNNTETHDATYIANIGGTGVTVGIGAGDGSSDPGTVLNYTTSADEAICNTWIRCGDEGGGTQSLPFTSFFLVRVS